MDSGGTVSALLRSMSRLSVERTMLVVARVWVTCRGGLISHSKNGGWSDILRGARCWSSRNCSRPGRSEGVCYLGVVTLVFRDMSSVIRVLEKAITGAVSSVTTLPAAGRTSLTPATHA